MARERLTEARVRKLKPVAGKQTDTWDLEVPGFGVRVSTRSKSYVISTRSPAGGYASRVVIGDADATSLADARKLAREMKAAVREGRDPLQERELRRQANVRQSADTFQGLVAGYLVAMGDGGLKPRSLREYQRVLLGPDFQPWRGLPAAAITPGMVADVIAAISRRAPSMGARSRAYLSALFGWAADEQKVPASPVPPKRPARGKARRKGGRRGRERTLTAEEIRDVWAATASGSNFAMVTRLLLLTGQRRSEIGDMTDAELAADGATWTIPGERTKNGRAHTVPLSAPARAIVENALMVARLTGEPGRSPRYLFGTRGKRGFGGWSASKARLDAAIGKMREKDGRQPMPHWTLHDLRRTVATLMSEELRVRSEIVEAILNHVSGHQGGVAGVYNRSKYLAEKTEALSAWGAFVLGVAEGKPARENVVQLRA